MCWMCSLICNFHLSVIFNLVFFFISIARFNLKDFESAKQSFEAVLSLDGKEEKHSSFLHIFILNTELSTTVKF